VYTEDSGGSKHYRNDLKKIGMILNSDWVYCIIFITRDYFVITIESVIISSSDRIIKCQMLLVVKLENDLFKKDNWMQQ